MKPSEELVVPLKVMVVEINPMPEDIDNSVNVEYSTSQVVQQVLHVHVRACVHYLS